MSEAITRAEGGAELYAALAKAQGEFKPVAKNRAVQIRMKEGGTYRFEYADLEALISATRPALAANSLAIVQQVTGDELITRLVHGDGDTLTSAMSLPRMGQDPKSYGAALTYLRRYAYSALLCLAADDDLDEDGRDIDDKGGKPEPEKKATPRRKAEGVPTPGPKPEDEPASPGEANWVKAKLAALDDGAERLEKLGIMNLQTLTKAQFLAARAELGKA